MPASQLPTRYVWPGDERQRKHGEYGREAVGGVVDADEVDHDRHNDGEDDPVSHAEQDAHELEERRPFDERQRHEAE